MKTALSGGNLLRELAASFRILPLTVFACSVLYTGAVYLAGRLFPESSSGSLVYSEKGQVIGSRLVAQQFIRPEYFWPRPSAVSWNAAGSGGSNLSPASAAMRDKTEKMLAALAPEPDEKVPADLVTASGSGLDPHISLASARFQAPRIAKARGISVDDVMRILNSPENGKITVPFLGEQLFNVLLLNCALDRLQ
jgi:K+-transporting ATPase ATPase C chain